MNASRLLVVGSFLCSIMVACPPWASAAQIAWQPELEQARKLAWQQNRLLLIHFWSPDCVPCLRLEQNVLRQDLVAEAINATVVPVKVDASQNPGLAALLGVQSWPTDVLVTPSGQTVARWQSPQDAEEYVSRFLQSTRTASLQLTELAQGTADAAGTVAQQGQRALQQADSQADLLVEDGRKSLEQMRQQASQWVESVESNLEDVTSRARNFGEVIGQSLPPSDPQSATVDNPFVASQATGTSPKVTATASPPPWQSDAAHGNPPSQRGPASNPNSAPPWASAVPPTGTSPSSDLDESAIPTSSPPPSSITTDAAARSEASNTWPSRSGTEDAVSPPDPSPTGRQAATSPPNRSSTKPDEDAHQEPGIHPPIGMEGYCPVTLLEDNKWARGDRQWGAIHRGRTYLFASQEYQRRFIASPDRYSPVLAGIDPVMLVDHGQVVAGKRAHGVVFDDHVYLFSSEEALRKFWSSPETYAQPIRQAMRTGSIQQMLR